jgi:hypothetical protein
MHMRMSSLPWYALACLGFSALRPDFMPARAPVLALRMNVVLAGAAVCLRLAFPGGLTRTAHPVALRTHSSALERKR